MGNAHLFGLNARRVLHHYSVLMFRRDILRLGRLTNGFFLAVDLDRSEMFRTAQDNVYAPACHVDRVLIVLASHGSVLAFGPLPFPPIDLDNSSVITWHGR